VYYSAGIWWLYHRELIQGGGTVARTAGRSSPTIVTFATIGEAAAAARMATMAGNGGVVGKRVNGGAGDPDSVIPRIGDIWL
jgi:hypothetical protein